MVASHLPQLSVANSIAAAVADVPDVHAVVLGRKERSHHGGAHAATFARLGAALEDLAVGDANAGKKSIFFLRQVGVEMKRPGYVFARGGLEEFGDGVGCQTAGYVAGAMAAHAVGDDEQIVVAQHNEAVFVVLSLEADVSETCSDRPHCSVAPSADDRPPAIVRRTPADEPNRGFHAAFLVSRPAARWGRDRGKVACLAGK